MKIQYNKGNGFRSESYQIRIEPFEDLEAEDIAKSFDSQFPKTKASIISSNVKKIEMKLIIIGLNLPKLKWKK